jgi:hypothetical protein
LIANITHRGDHLILRTQGNDRTAAGKLGAERAAFTRDLHTIFSNAQFDTRKAR